MNTSVEEVEEEVSEERPRPAGAVGWFGDIVRSWGPAILAILFIRAFIFEPFRIPSGSMVPTLLIGDHVLVTKFSYGVWLPWTRIELLDLGDPQRGDIIVFRYPLQPSTNYIKRVVALPGDKIAVQGNQILINGERQSRTYLDRFEYVDDSCNARKTRRFVENLTGLTHNTLNNTGPGPLANHEEIVVPEGNVFVMGDNRDNSEDSRRWGFVRYDQIKGKAHFVWLSWDGCAGRIRSERFFHPLYGSEGGA